MSLVEVCSFCYRFLDVAERDGLTEGRAAMMTEHLTTVHHLHPYEAQR